MTRAVFSVKVNESRWLVIAPDSLSALALVRERHRESWNEEEDPDRYPGFASSFTVERLGTVDAEAT